MDNGIMKTETVVPTVRGIEIVTAEIREIRRQANTMAMMYAIEIGRRLCEAKSLLGHGEWGDWLRNEVEFSQSTANNLMKLFDEYGEAQISIFGASANSQTIGKLPYSKALALLSLPAEEREDFAEEVGAEDLSVRELKEAIRERNEAREREAELAARIEEAEKSAKEADDAKEEAARLRVELAKLEAEKKTADEKLAAALKDPKIPPAKMKAIKNEAAEQARKDAALAASDEIEAAKKKAEEAEKKYREAEARRLEAEDRLIEARNELKTASPAVSAFKAMFDAFQRSARELKAKAAEVEKDDPETGAKLKAALAAVAKTLEG